MVVITKSFTFKVGPYWGWGFRFRQTGNFRRIDFEIPHHIGYIEFSQRRLGS